jgi:hypothetical protein
VPRQLKEYLLQRTTFEGLIPFRYTRILPVPRGSLSETNMTANPANLRNHERFAELFELASEEPDQEKVGAIFEEILRLLESQTTPLDHTATDGEPHPTVVLM